MNIKLGASCGKNQGLFPGLAEHWVQTAEGKKKIKTQQKKGKGDNGRGRPRNASFLGEYTELGKHRGRQRASEHRGNRGKDSVKLAWLLQPRSPSDDQVSRDFTEMSARKALWGNPETVVIVRSPTTPRWSESLDTEAKPRHARPGSSALIGGHAPDYLRWVKLAQCKLWRLPCLPPPTWSTTLCSLHTSAQLP